MDFVRAAAVAALLLLAACAPPPAERAAGVGTPADFPAAAYRQAAAVGAPVLQVAPQRSLVTVEVHRAGALARLGHDHIVASRDVEGFAALDAGEADLYVPLAGLTVDEPELRAAAHFDSEPPAAAIAGTRRNMLERVLEVERFPFARIHVGRPDPGAARLKLALTLHGVTREFDIPATIEELPEGIAVGGAFALRQSDFGIVPMAVLGGALQVADEVGLRFRIVALRTSGAR